MTFVMTMTANKDKKIQIRLKADIKEDFEAVAEFRGLTPTALIHSFIVRTVHETRAENPQIFAVAQKEDSKIKAEKESEELEKISTKSKKGKSAQPKKTFTTGDGKKIPLVDEAQSFDDDGQ